MDKNAMMRRLSRGNKKTLEPGNGPRVPSNMNNQTINDLFNRRKKNRGSVLGDMMMKRK